MNFFISDDNSIIPECDIYVIVYRADDENALAISEHFLFILKQIINQKLEMG